MRKKSIDEKLLKTQKGDQIFLLVILVSGGQVTHEIDLNTEKLGVKIKYFGQLKNNCVR